MSGPLTAAAFVLALGAAADPPADNGFSDASSDRATVTAQRRQTCGDVSSCREAVVLWCDGYERADADDDGIPCETVCPSLEIVEAIREEIGC